MSIYLADMTTFAVLFEFDCELKENAKTEVDWTSKPIEAGALVSDFGVTKEDTFRVEGLITAWPFVGIPKNYQRVIQADTQLRALAKLKQPLTLITGWWTPTVTIKVIDGSSGKAEGEALRIAIDCTTITQPEIVYTAMPASRIDPTKRKRGAPGSTGGAATGKPKTDVSESILHGWIY